MVNTRVLEPGIEPYVLPIQCEQVFYSEVPSKVGWSFVVRHDPRGRVVKYSLDDGNEKGSLEEEYDDEEHDEIELVDEDVQEIVESYDVADNVDEYYFDDDTMSVTDDDDNMIWPILTILTMYLMIQMMTWMNKTLTWMKKTMKYIER